jgi:hypothetical protein
MTRPAPTARQLEVVQAIAQLTAAEGYGPTLREVAGHLRCHWTNVAKLARKAQAAGLLEHEPGRARSWRVVK